MRRVTLELPQSRVHLRSYGISSVSSLRCLSHSSCSSYSLHLRHKLATSCPRDPSSIQASCQTTGSPPTPVTTPPSHHTAPAPSPRQSASLSKSLSYCLFCQQYYLRARRIRSFSHIRKNCLRGNQAESNTRREHTQKAHTRGADGKMSSPKRRIETDVCGQRNFGTEQCG